QSAQPLVRLPALLLRNVPLIMGKLLVVGTHRTVGQGGRRRVLRAAAYRARLTGEQVICQLTRHVVDPCLAQVEQPLSRVLRAIDEHSEQVMLTRSADDEVITQL